MNTLECIQNPKEQILRLYETENGKLYNFIRRMTGDETLTEDILQETFLRALEKAETFRGESSLTTWIFAIAKNNCLQHLRNVKRTRFSVMEGLIAEASVSGENTPLNEAEKRICINQVKEGCLLGLLRCLPLNQRLAFILNVLYDISVEEISRIIDKSTNAVRILIHRSRTQIKDFLCENPIEFSLKNRWISKDNAAFDISEIESDLHKFKDEIRLYRSLQERKIPEYTSERIKEYIRSSGAKIFSKKVK